MNIGEALMDEPKRATAKLRRPAAAEAYLDQLTRSLEGVDRAERQEVLTSMREHIDENVAALGHPPTPAEINAILVGLGSVEAVLATLEYETPGPQDRGTQARATSWLPGVAVVAGMLSLLQLINVIVAVLLAMVAVVIGILGVRRKDARRSLYILALVLGSLSLVATAVLAFGALAASVVPATVPAVSVTPTGP
jgi:Flp pilus assembly protein TadB